MKIINLFLLAVCLTVAAAIDEGDWVDPYNLPIGFPTHPFLLVIYLSILSKSTIMLILQNLTQAKILL